MIDWVPKKKIIRFAVITALFGIILYFGGLFIVSSKINKVENAYNSTESESYKKDKILRIKFLADTNKELIQTLQDFFVQKGDEVKFIEQIEKIARDSAINAEIIYIETKADQPESFKENVDVKMNVEGSWQNIMSFVDKLEKMSLGVSVEEVNLNANTPGDWSGSVEFIVFREK